MLQEYMSQEWAQKTAQTLADETGESAYVSEIGDSGWYRVIRQSELTPITAHCAQQEFKPNDNRQRPS